MSVQHPAKYGTSVLWLYYLSPLESLGFVTGNNYQTIMTLQPLILILILLAIHFEVCAPLKHILFLDRAWISALHLNKNNT